MRRIFCPKILQRCFLVLPIVAPAAFAQAPDSATAAVTPLGVLITYTVCVTSEDPSCDNIEISVFRDPPGFNANWAIHTTVGNANLATHQIMDQSIAKGQSYTYAVCLGETYVAADCRTTNKVTVPVPSNPPPTNNPPTTNTNNTPTYWTPPQNIKMKSGGTLVVLSWTNPPNKPYPPFDITVERGTPYTSAWTLVADLNQMANNYHLNTSYTDTGPFMPHASYNYLLCEGDPASIAAQYGNNCAKTGFFSTWGADPVLTATRVNATTVKLTVAVDNGAAFQGMSITREGSDDPCRQGTTLSNGLQGCPTRTVGPNGVAAPVGNITTLDLASLAGSVSSPLGFGPWSISYLDNTVKPGVEYYYIAHVNLNGSQQDSAVATAPSQYALLPPPSKMTLGAIKPIKTPSPMPAPVAGRTAMTVRAAPPAAARLAPASLDSAVANAQQNPRDAGALYALGQAYCTARVRSICLNLLYMSYLQAQNAGNASLAAEIRSRLAQQGVNVE
jgi:hypothetical protein